MADHGVAAIRAAPWTQAAAADTAAANDGAEGSSCCSEKARETGLTVWLATHHPTINRGAIIAAREEA